MQACPRCGEQNPPGFRLCGYCGASLAPAAPPREVRKVVTILFCDLKGSTSLGERLDPESLREVMSRYFDVVSAAIASHGGTIEKFIGDAVMAVFGIPRVHEDDALRAVRAALAMQAAVTRLNGELRRLYGVELANGTGITTGEVVAGDAAAGQRFVTGDAVNVAARLEQAAGEREVLIGDPTCRLVRGHVEVEPVEPLELKGKSARVPAFRLLGLRGRGGADFGGRLVGRAAEIAALEDAATAAERARRCEVAVVTGDAGLGKSRLLDELARRVSGRARVVRGACLSYGDGITFWPLREVVREAAAIGDGDDLAAAQEKLYALVGEPDVAERVGAAVGLSPRQYPLYEIFWAVRRLFELLARDRPLLFLLDDVHWAEPTLLDLVDALAASVEAPVLIVAAGRLELLDARPAWKAERHVALGALGAEESSRMIDAALLGAPVAAGARRRIVEAGGGNPLFIEQLVSMMVEDGLLVSANGVWDVEELPAGWVPPTIHALLGARLDSLGREERAVIDPASVIGQRFPPSALAELAEEFVQAQVDGRLGDLVRKQFVVREELDLYRFEHILIREAVYDALLKRARAALHERYVAWADRVNGDRAAEFDEILGYHLEQAHRYLVELGPADEHALRLARDGAHRLSAAGRRAFERGDMPAASGLLLRATSLLPPLDAARLRLFPDLGEALLQVGDVARAESLLDDAVAAAELAGEPAIAATIDVVRMLVRRLTGSDASWAEQALRTATAAVAAAEQAGDDAAAARAWRLVASIRGNACRHEEGVEAIEAALRHARRAGDARQERRSATVYALLLAYGPTPVPEAIARCEELAPRVAGDRQAEAALLCVLGHLRALAGELAAARDLMRRSRAVFEELGLRVDAAVLSIQAAHVEFLAADPAAAEAELRRGFEVLDELGDRYWLASIAGLLAHAAYGQGRFDEARELSAVAEARARLDDVDAQALWRCARAKVLVHGGDFGAGERLAREAVELLRPTDAVLFQVAALADLAEVLAAAGRADEAAVAVREALGLAEAKRAAPLAARLRAFA